MTVRTSPPVTFGPGDFLRTDRGVTWGIKVTDTPDAKFVSVFTRSADMVWGIDIGEALLESEMDLSAGLYPDVKDWLKKKLIPNLNAWLASSRPNVLTMWHVTPGSAYCVKV